MLAQAKRKEHALHSCLVVELVLGQIAVGLEERVARLLSGLDGDQRGDLEQFVEDAREIFVVGRDAVVLCLALGIEYLDENLGFVGEITLAPEQAEEK